MKEKWVIEFDWRSDEGEGAPRLVGLFDSSDEAHQWLDSLSGVDFEANARPVAIVEASP